MKKILSLALLAALSAAPAMAETATGTAARSNAAALDQIADLRVKIAEENKRHIEVMNQLRDQLNKKQEEAKSLRAESKAKHETATRAKAEAAEKKAAEKAEKKDAKADAKADAKTETKK